MPRSRHGDQGTITDNRTGNHNNGNGGTAAVATWPGELIKGDVAIYDWSALGVGF